MACLFLATKLEETARKHREIISVFHRVERRREGRGLEPLDLYGNVRPVAGYLCALLLRVQACHHLHAVLAGVQ